MDGERADEDEAMEEDIAQMDFDIAEEEVLNREMIMNTKMNSSKFRRTGTLILNPWVPLAIFTCTFALETLQVDHSPSSPSSAASSGDDASESRFGMPTAASFREPGHLHFMKGIAI